MYVVFQQQIVHRTYHGSCTSFFQTEPTVVDPARRSGRDRKTLPSTFKRYPRKRPCTMPHEEFLRRPFIFLLASFFQLSKLLPRQALGRVPFRMLAMRWSPHQLNCCPTWKFDLLPTLPRSFRAMTRCFLLRHDSVARELPSAHLGSGRFPGR